MDRYRYILISAKSKLHQIQNVFQSRCSILFIAFFNFVNFFVFINCISGIKGNIKNLVCLIKHIFAQ